MYFNELELFTLGYTPLQDVRVLFVINLICSLLNKSKTLLKFMLPVKATKECAVPSQTFIEITISDFCLAFRTYASTYMGSNVKL